MPARGARRFRSTSTASAFSGETYRTRHRSFALGCDVRVRSSRAHKKAASVLPDPVGAMTSAFSPAEMACHAPICAAVGRAKTSRNQVAVAGEKTSSGSAGTLSILPSTTDIPVSHGPLAARWPGTMAAVKETELWQRLQLHLGAGYFRVWAAEYSLAALGQRTVVEALADGVPCKIIWRAVWAALELPARDR
jgi:hypothetical protein